MPSVFQGGSLFELPCASTLPLAFVRIAEALTSLKPPQLAVSDDPVAPAKAMATPGSGADPTCMQGFSGAERSNGAAQRKAPQLTRVEVEIEEIIEPAHWLAHQPVYPRVYFSNQHKSLRAAGVGAAERIGGKDFQSDDALASVYESLAGACSRMRFYGGMRFDSDAEQDQEWSTFGSSFFVLPQWELQVCDGERTFLACHLRWWPARDVENIRATDPSDATNATRGTIRHVTWEQATRDALLGLHRIHRSAEVVSSVHQALPTLVSHQGSLDAGDWETAVKCVLEGINSGDWSKVVLAQRVMLHFSAALEPMHLLLRLLEADYAAIAQDSGGLPSHVSGTRHAYIFLLQLEPEAAFIGCTPEKLFKLEGDQLSTEALAGTRPRGDCSESDAALAHELLHCEKDLREVMAICDFLERVLSPACEQLKRSVPFVLQLRHVQHICIPFSAKLLPAEGMYEPVRAALALLHPTPAVCGTPSSAAHSTIRKLESFDRGFYAGPLGYLASDSCEFCVGIRSALVRGAKAAIFAGAGIVRGSTATSEWEEVHVKMKNFVSLFPRASHLASTAAPSSPFLRLPNLNALYSSLFFEELLRCGLAHVVLSPGSRCAPLTVAVARSGCAHSLANDERGAAFMALGFARASGRCAAVVVSSGTAVANLLPAVVEASQDHVPLLLLTADRPPELRDTAANQTIDQVGMLGSGGILRWFKDMPCPSVDMPLEALLADASYAVACATGPVCGPVHLNFMLREPLAPSEVPWPRELLTSSKRVSNWLHSRQPFTSYMRPYQSVPLQPDAQLLPVLEILRTARRGVVVAGAMFTSAQRRATLAFASHLGWPVLPDVCSGLRNSAFRTSKAHVVPLYDLLLANSELVNALDVDVIFQVGGRLISKRLQALVASSTSHILLEEHGERMDPSYCVTHRLQGEIATLLTTMQFGLACDTMPPNPLVSLCEASCAAEVEVQSWLTRPGSEISEAWVARHICSVISAVGAEDEAVFVSNSMPIRYLDMLCPVAPTVLCNRGASGIDGILHTAIGATLGAGGRCTLLVGDLATLHDLNGLSTLSNSNLPLVIVVLNNAGGGIFRFLPIASHEDVYSPYFDTPHKHNFARCCEGFGLPYTCATNSTDFETAFECARRSAGPHVIEVPTEMEAGHATVASLKNATRDVAHELSTRLPK